MYTALSMGSLERNSSARDAVSAKPLVLNSPAEGVLISEPTPPFNRRPDIQFEIIVNGDQPQTENSNKINFSSSKPNPEDDFSPIENILKKMSEDAVPDLFFPEMGVSKGSNGGEGKPPIKVSIESWTVRKLPQGPVQQPREPSMSFRPTMQPRRDSMDDFFDSFLRPMPRGVWRPFPRPFMPVQFPENKPQEEGSIIITPLVRNSERKPDFEDNIFPHSIFKDVEGIFKQLLNDNDKVEKPIKKNDTASRDVEKVENLGGQKPNADVEVFKKMDKRLLDRLEGDEKTVPKTNMRPQQQEFPMTFFFDVPAEEMNLRKYPKKYMAAPKVSMSDSAEVKKQQVTQANSTPQAPQTTENKRPENI